MVGRYAPEDGGILPPHNYWKKGMINRLVWKIEGASRFVALTTSMDYGPASWRIVGGAPSRIVGPLPRPLLL